MKSGVGAIIFLVIMAVIVYTTFSTLTKTPSPTGKTFNEKTQTEGIPEENAQQVEEQQDEKELTTTITPARDLTGQWTGAAQWQDNVANPACSYQGDIVFNFQQNGNTLAGTWYVIITEVAQYIESVPCSPQGPGPENPLQGTVSSSTFEFASGSPELVFEGTFTSDLMQGTFESCPGQCPGGTVGSIGDFSARRS